MKKISKKTMQTAPAKKGKKLRISQDFKDYFLARLKKHKLLNFCCMEFDFDPESLFITAEQCLPNIDELTEAIENVIENSFGKGDSGSEFAYKISQLCGVPNQSDAWEFLFEKKELEYLVNQIDLGFWDSYEGPSLHQSSKIIANEFIELPKKLNKTLLISPLCAGIEKSNELYAIDFGED